MARALMLSLLADQRARLGDGFLARYNHPWLVWEPSAWAAPSADGVTRVDRERDAWDQAGNPDSLCFGIVLAEDQNELRLGRASDNDLVVNDGTVSRHHASLTRNAFGTWQLRPLPGSNGTRVGPRILAEGEVAPLVDRQRFRVGDVELVFVQPLTMVQRLTLMKTDA